MIPRVSPAIDPLAQRAAIQALEAQRAAYARYARGADANRARLAGGDGTVATAAADEAVRGMGELEDGARRLAPLVSDAAAGASPDERQLLDRQIDAVLREARQAEAAIHNLTAQLEAWRSAYARQLSDAGVPTGTDGGTPGDDAAAPAAARGAGYTAPGGGRTRTAPALFDRRG